MEERILPEKSLESYPMNARFNRSAGDASRSATLGFVAGLRSQVPLALLAIATNRGDVGR